VKKNQATGYRMIASCRTVQYHPQLREQGAAPFRAIPRTHALAWSATCRGGAWHQMFGFDWAEIGSHWVTRPVPFAASGAITCRAARRNGLLPTRLDRRGAGGHGADLVKKKGRDEARPRGARLQKIQLAPIAAPFWLSALTFSSLVDPSTRRPAV
jgi:hypothetical protein